MKGNPMTDEQIARHVETIKSTASPNGGLLAEQMGDEIRRLRILIGKVRCLHSAEFTRHAVMKILNEESA
jgi:hypothetical protein